MQEGEKPSADQPGAPPPPATAPTPKPKSSSKLTAEQQAEWEAKLRLIVEQEEEMMRVARLILETRRVEQRRSVEYYHTLVNTPGDSETRTPPHLCSQVPWLMNFPSLYLIRDTCQGH